MTDFEYWERKVLKLVANGAVDEHTSVLDVAFAIRHDDSLTKFEKEALIHKLWEAF